MRPFDVHVELIMGHFQTGLLRTGFETLYTEIVELVKPSPLLVNVNLSKWNAKRKEQIEHLHRVCTKDCVFIVAGFSHGVGCGSIRFAKCLKGVGRDVSRLFSADGVYWSRYMPWRAITSPIFGEPTIKLPSNVKHVDMWRQKENKPCGHPIAVRPTWNDMIGRRVAENKVVDHGFLPYVHSAMDEREEIHKAVKDCVKLFSQAS